MRITIPPWQDHLGLLVGFAAIFATAINVLAFSRWHPEVALAVVHNVSTSTVLIGAAMATLPTVLAILLQVALMYLFARIARREGTNLVIVLTTFTLLLFAVVALPVFQLGLAVLAGALAALLARWFGIPYSTDSGKFTLTRYEFLFVALLPQLVGAAMVGIAWMPTENLRFEKGSTIVAYVLREGEGEAVILLDRPRIVQYVRNNKLLDREVCSGRQDWYLQTMPDAVTPERLPPCTRP
ncbi:hypothetical protein GC722_05450 [Auraticoccus sp. F435]|uniref:Uncharacterized protein n=1 Tax=Auraticoccus cholistanensis TaxID=2656650 RepID=A0A6A9URG2_9ACTN|nr:hypothetical protein [Auraticoccus cholistanensis]MVA75476.1 hypothetical protein [Auraticoccus cholistanensis]